MTFFIILFSVLGFIEIRFKPRFDYIEESSVLVFYFFARPLGLKRSANNQRKRIIFKIW